MQKFEVGDVVVCTRPGCGDTPSLIKGEKYIVYDVVVNFTSEDMVRVVDPSNGKISGGWLISRFEVIGE